MKVRMNVDISGTRNGEAWPARGETVEVTDTEGAELCAAGLATPVTVDKVEKAVAPEPEKRASRRRG